MVSAHAADVVCARCASSAASTRAVACGPPSVTLRFFPLAYLLPYLHRAYRPLPVLRSARGAARSMRRRLLFPTHWFPRRARPAFARTRTCTAQGKGGEEGGFTTEKRTDWILPRSPVGNGRMAAEKRQNRGRIRVGTFRNFRNMAAPTRSRTLATAGQGFEAGLRRGIRRG